MLAVLCAGSLLADEATVKKGGAEVPADISDPMKAALNAEAITVLLEGKAIAHVWLVKEIQHAESANTELGVGFGKLASGSLLGVIQFPEEWSDYKENPISAGVYTLRYAVMPADGNHMGVATYRDFLLLAPPAADTDPANPLGYAEMLVASAEATGVVHPGVLALYPIWDEVTEPKLVKNDLDQWTLAVKVGSQVLGLIMVGHGEL
jgi:hypothetical protein